MTRKANFFEEYSWFKFNNLGLALGITLTFYAIVVEKYIYIYNNKKSIWKPDKNHSTLNTFTVAVDNDIENLLTKKLYFRKKNPK